MRFVYSVIRFVPDNVRGEFINIGVIVGTDDSEHGSAWKFQLTEDWERATQLDSHQSPFVLPHVQEHLNEVLPMIAGWGDEGDGESKLRQLCHDWQNCVQLSEPLPLVANSCDEALTPTMSLFVD